MEQIIHRRLYCCLAEHNILTSSQCGLRPALGTNDSLSRLFDYIYNDINNDISTIAIYFDLRKAFDAIDRNYTINETRIYRNS